MTEAEKAADERPSDERTRMTTSAYRRELATAEELHHRARQTRLAVKDALGCPGRRPVERLP